MKLLAAVWPRVQRLVPSADRGMAFAIVGFLAGLELVGRKNTAEWQDALAGVALVLGVMFVLAWHRSQPVAWLDSLRRFVMRQANRFEHLKYDVGVDFRGTPAFPQGVPRLISAAVVGLVLLSAACVAIWFYLPEGWRTIGVQTSYVMYLMVLMSLWSMLVACVVVGIYVPVSIFDQKMRLAAGEDDPRGADSFVVLGYTAMALLVAWMTPPMYGLALCAMVAVVGGISYWLPTADDAVVLWRGGHGQPIYGVPMRRLLALGVVVVSLLVADLILAACAGQLQSAPRLEGSMPITAFLGTLTAWLVPGLMLAGLYQLIVFRRTDPTRRMPLTVRLTSKEPLSLQREALKHLRNWRFRATNASRTPGGAEPVGVRLVQPEKSQATEFDPDWPLALAMPDLESATVRERIVRRDEIQLRRQFRRGMSKLVKIAHTSLEELHELPNSPFESNSDDGPSDNGGLWLAPHWWFIETMLWEEPHRAALGDAADPLRPVGPPFARTFAPRVRQYLHQVLRSVQVDLIYLEQGIGHRKLELVFRSLLEVYDIHGGRRRVEESHFQGIPKIRVMIHDYSPGNPFESDVYPEPKFDDVSRFRVLHIFRDRDESKVDAEQPFDFSWEPSPLVLM